MHADRLITGIRALSARCTCCAFCADDAQTISGRVRYYKCYVVRPRMEEQDGIIKVYAPSRLQTCLICGTLATREDNRLFEQSPARAGVVSGLDSRGAFKGIWGNSAQRRDVRTMDTRSQAALFFRGYKNIPQIQRGRIPPPRCPQTVPGFSLDRRVQLLRWLCPVLSCHSVCLTGEAESLGHAER